MPAVTVERINHRERSVAERILAIQLAAYSQEAKLLGVSEFPPLARDVGAVQMSTECFLGAYLCEELVGVIGLEQAESAGTICISSLVVAPESQRLGVGRELLTAAVTDFSSKVLVVSTAAANAPAIALYAQLGFVEGGRRLVGVERLELVELRKPSSNPLHELPLSMNCQNLQFSPTSAADAEGLAALRIEAMRESLERIGRFDPARARERFLSGFSPPHTRHVELNGERVGFFVVKPCDQGLLLDHLCVHPRHQGNGIGAAVLAQVLAEADLQGSSVRVGALRGSDSNRFYVRHGFVPVEQAEFDIYYVRLPHKAR